MTDSRVRVKLGRLGGVYGVKGWFRVRTDTDPPEAIGEYPAWQLCRDGDWTEWQLAESRTHGKGLIVRLEGISDRDAAARLTGSDIAVFRDQMPDLPAGEYYWFDLQGLQVVTRDGVELGRLDYLFDTGANDVMVVAGERKLLIPWIKPEVVEMVDIVGGVVQVNWDPDF